MRRHDLGLVSVHAPPTPSADLIFVHGLSGHRSLTNKSGGFWLSWLENRLPHVSLWTYEYDAHAVFGSQDDLGVHATRFLSNLLHRPSRDRGNDITQKPIIFVAHSLGGILVKKAMILASSPESGWNGIFQKTTGIIFLGTPHQGSHPAIRTSLLIRCIPWLPSSGLLRILHAKSSLLAQMAGQFNDIWGSRPIFSFRETTAIFGFGMIVPQQSAITNCQGEKVIDVPNCNHSEISTPDSVQSPLFAQILNVIQSLLSSESTTSNLHGPDTLPESPQAFPPTQAGPVRDGRREWSESTPNSEIQTQATLSTIQRVHTSPHTFVSSTSNHVVSDHTPAHANVASSSRMTSRMDYDQNLSRKYPYDHSPLLFMSSEVSGSQDTQQHQSSELEEMWNLQTISPSDLSVPSPNNYIQIYEDDDDSFSHPHNSVPPIDIAIATSSLNPRGPPSSDPATPITPVLLSPSHLGYPSSPGLMNVTPPTPSRTLGAVSDVYHTFPPSAPISPYRFQRSPWHIANAYPSTEPERGLPFSEHQRGPMVPQKRYKPHTSSVRRHYVEEVNLEPSIYFYMKSPDELGIPLRDALHGRFAKLVGRDEPMLKECGPSIAVRLNWPGYQPWSRQIPTRDFRNPPGPITRSKLAKNVAKSVARFITEHQGRSMEEDGEPIWAVGTRKIKVTDLVLVRLDHVSKTSWQAQLQLFRPFHRQ